MHALRRRIEHQVPFELTKRRGKSQHLKALGLTLIKPTRDASWGPGTQNIRVDK